MSFHSFFGDTTARTGFFHQGASVRVHQSPFEKLHTPHSAPMKKHEDALSSAWHVIETTVGGGAHKVEDTLQSAYHAVVHAAGNGVHVIQSGAHEVGSIINAGAQGGINAFNAIGFPDFVKGVEGDVVQMLGPSPLISGLGGSIITLGAILGAFLLLK